MLRIAVVIVGLATLLCPAVAEESWNERVLSEACVAVELPGPVVQAAQPMPSAAGELTYHSALVDFGNAAVVIGWADFPQSLVTPASLNAILDESARGAAGSMNGTVQRLEPVMLEGHHGRDAFITAQVQGQMLFIRVRVFMVGHRQVQQLVLHHDEATCHAWAQRIADTMVLLPPLTETPVITPAP